MTLADETKPGQFSRVPFHVDITALNRSEIVTYLVLLRACWRGALVTTTELAVLARFDRATVARALRSLMRRRLIKRIGPSHSPRGCGYRFEGIDYPAGSSDPAVSGRSTCDPQITSSPPPTCDPQITSLVIPGSQVARDTDLYLDPVDPSLRPSHATQGHIGQPARVASEGSDLNLRVQDHLRRGCDRRYSLAEIDRVICRARAQARARGLELSDADLARHSDRQTDDQGLRRARSPLHAMLAGHRLEELIEMVAARQTRRRAAPRAAPREPRIDAAAVEAALASLKR